mmetsp:Transcript_32745/g.50108  ORF Transcript_32745/g.50108 Transcript_32745/m.50108 type:complete len:94 (-) Transcript_32745:2028-2309(-)
MVAMLFLIICRVASLVSLRAPMREHRGSNRDTEYNKKVLILAAHDMVEKWTLTYIPGLNLSTNSSSSTSILHAIEAFATVRAHSSILRKGVRK